MKTFSEILTEKTFSVDKIAGDAAKKPNPWMSINPEKFFNMNPDFMRDQVKGDLDWYFFTKRKLKDDMKAFIKDNFDKIVDLVLKKLTKK